MKNTSTNFKSNETLMEIIGVSIWGRLIFKLLQTIRELAFRSIFISKTLSCFPLGKIVFRMNIIIKWLLLSLGWSDQRVIEYPWLLKQLKLLKPGSIILDVGCSESILSCELISRKYNVVGIDIQNYVFKSPRMLFVKRNILDTGFPSKFFDGIIMISTIEHIGLNVYGQTLLDGEGDIKAMKELFRILKPGGLLIMTTPYIGKGPFRLSEFERNYDRERLKKLIEGYNILREDYFYPKLLKNGRVNWIKLNKKQIDKLTFNILSGLACLVLQKQ